MGEAGDDPFPAPRGVPDGIEARRDAPRSCFGEESRGRAPVELRHDERAGDVQGAPGEEDVGV
jgi:hypothetical protein